MPEGELPDHIKDRLSASLETGAPLRAPLPSQARYAAKVVGVPAPRWRLRSVMVAAAAAGVVVIALASPAEPRDWIVQSVGNIAHDAGLPVGSTSPSPTPASGRTVHESPEANESNESPEANESPGSSQSTEPMQSPEAHESPEPSQSPDGGDQPTPSPTPQPSGGGDDGSGGDHSPEPSPSS